jgi:hypothetical protein
MHVSSVRCSVFTWARSTLLSEAWMPDEQPWMNERNWRSVEHKTGHHYYYIAFVLLVGVPLIIAIILTRVLITDHACISVLSTVLHLSPYIRCSRTLQLGGYKWAMVPSLTLRVIVPLGWSTLLPCRKWDWEAPGNGTPAGELSWAVYIGKQAQGPGDYQKTPPASTHFSINLVCRWVLICRL